VPLLFFAYNINNMEMLYVDMVILYLKYVIKPLLEIIAIYVLVYYLFKQIFLIRCKEKKIQRRG